MGTAVPLRSHFKRFKAVLEALDVKVTIYENQLGYRDVVHIRIDLQYQ